MHAGKSGESTPAATKGRRRLGHRLTLWSVTRNVSPNSPPRPRLSMEASQHFLDGASTPPLRGGEHPRLLTLFHPVQSWRNGRCQKLQCGDGKCAREHVVSSLVAADVSSE